MKIVDIDGKNITVEFQDEHRYKTVTIYQHFRKGTIKNPYDKTIIGIGCIGDGKYRCWESNKHTLTYTTWQGMLTRCYYEKEMMKHDTYFNKCKVCDEWFNYQNFAEWYEQNKYPLNERLHIDKDILIKGNKLYSPDTCLLVPQRINMMFMDISSKRIHDKDLPQGISRSKFKDGTVRYCVMYAGKSLGTYDTFEEAIEKYKKARKRHIIDVANEYKNVIPIKVYEALIKCEP